MKSNKTLAALVTLGLAAAVATPAMALENQISGSFTSFFDVSNYSANGNSVGSTNNEVGLKKYAPTENYFVQRARLGYTAKANENVKLVTKFELDYEFFGNNEYTAHRNAGGGLGADSVNLETKNIYLDFNLPAHTNVKIGMMGYADSFKGILFDADMAGVLINHEYSNASASLGYFRFNDSTDITGAYSTIGKYTNDMLAIDGKYSITKDSKVGLSYYFFNDNRNDGTMPGETGNVKVHTLGLNGETVVGPISLSGFALAQFGKLAKDVHAHGYALEVGAKMPLAGGTARSELLYTSGGSKDKLYVPQSKFGSEGAALYDSELIMLHRDKNAMTIDSAIVYDTNNFNQGVILGSLGYDYNFTPKLSGSANAGFAAVAKDNATSGDHKSNYLGTEINVETNYKLASSVTLGARAGYVFLGDYFTNTNAGHARYDNPYDVKLIAKYSF